MATAYWLMLVQFLALDMFLCHDTRDLNVPNVQEMLLIQWLIRNERKYYIQHSQDIILAFSSFSVPLIPHSCSSSQFELACVCTVKQCTVCTLLQEPLEQCFNLPLGLWTNPFTFTFHFNWDNNTYKFFTLVYWTYCMSNAGLLYVNSRITEAIWCLSKQNMQVNIITSIRIDKKVSFYVKYSI